MAVNRTIKRKLVITRYTTSGPDKLKFDVLDKINTGKDGKGLWKSVFSTTVSVGEKARMVQALLSKYRIHRDAIEEKEHDSAQKETGAGVDSQA